MAAMKMAIPRFTLRTMFGVVTIACVLLLLLSWQPPPFRQIVYMTVPFFLGISAISILFASPLKAALSYFLIHAIAAIVFLSWSLEGPRTEMTPLVRIAPMFLIDLPVAFFYHEWWIEGDVEIGIPQGGMMTLLGGAWWAFIGWLVAKNREEGAKRRTVIALWMSAAILVIHTILVVGDLLWCAAAEDGGTRAERLMVMIRLDFPVALVLFQVFEQHHPTNISGISIQQGLWLIVLGGIFWTGMSWLIIRACKCPTLVRKMFDVAQ